MKNILFILMTATLMLSCSKKITVTKLECNESEAFKKMFFSNVENIEKNISTNQRDSFRNSLKIISKYVHVSFESMLNYDHSYTYDALRKDKENWLKWYDLNKCNDLKIVYDSVPTYHFRN